MKLYKINGELLIEGKYNSVKELLEKNRDADLTGAYLTGADLTGAYLTGAYLTGAYLRDADLRDADLTGADLTGADLRDADLTGADLTGADLRGADLTGADLTGADWNAKITLKNSIVCINNLNYTIYLLDNHIQIGCECHSFEDWKNFTNKDIIAMDGKKALEWWCIWKESIIKMMETKIKNDQEGNND